MQVWIVAIRGYDEGNDVVVGVGKDQDAAERIMDNYVQRSDAKWRQIVRTDGVETVPDGRVKWELPALWYLVAEPHAVVS